MPVIPKWNAREAWDILIPFLRKSIKSGKVEHPPYVSTPEIWEEFVKGVVWKDIQTFLIERSLDSLMELSAETDNSKRDALQSALGECMKLMYLNESIIEELETIREEEKQDQPEPNKE